MLVSERDFCGLVRISDIFKSKGKKLRIWTNAIFYFDFFFGLFESDRVRSDTLTSGPVLVNF